MTTGNTPAGWYDDPSGQANTERWWDGSAWSGRTRPKSAADTATVSSGTGGGAGQGVPGAFGPAPAVSATPTVVTPAAAPVAPQPFTPTSVVFETVEANTGRRKLLLGVGAVLLSVVMAGAGYVVGNRSTDKIVNPKAGGSASPTATADPKSPNGFMGATLTGGQQYPGGKQVTGQESKMNFLLPADWQVQSDAKNPSDVRYAVSPYACVGHGSGACTRGLVVQNLRVFNGGWADPKSMVLGMGQLLYNTRFGSDAPTPPEPLKQSAVKIQGMDGYLALWHVPMSSGSSTPDAYCGVLEVTPAAGATTVPVLQICLDQAAEAPALTLMDQIANSVKITP
ncbi:DUF2510 domain-containing protein [Kitasatospora purpeofusca]|uniref:DUF2510 domain-containing protein n=1 Tax=Kitasatospora purpeofusca TaxID=67352 RepID=UPI003867D990|nr:DUF2510 domain-containing protein [Kitasatospora purpeofusca]